MDSKQSKDEILLEVCNENKTLKNKLLRDVAKREINYVLNLGNNIGSKKIRLERALEKAYEW